MIEFACQHCGNQVRSEDGLAGREARCRVCNGFIVIPGSGTPRLLEDLAPEDLLKRLFRMQEFATTGADEFKKSPFDLRQERQFKQAESLLAEGQDEAARLRHEIDGIQSRLTGRESEVEFVSSALGSEVQEAQSTIEDLENRLRVAEAALASFGSDTAGPEAAGSAEDGVEELERSLSEREAATKAYEERIRSLERSLSDRDAQLGALKQTATMSRVAISDMESEVLKATNKLTALEDAQSRFREEAAAEREELESRLQTLQAALNLRTSAEPSLAEANNVEESVCKESQEPLDKARQSASEADEVVASQATQIEDLLEQVDDLSGELEGFRSQQESEPTGSSVELDSLRGEIRDLSAQNQELVEQLAAKEARVITLEEESGLYDLVRMDLPVAWERSRDAKTAGGRGRGPRTNPISRAVRVILDGW